MFAIFNFHPKLLISSRMSTYGSPLLKIYLSSLANTFEEFNCED